MHKYLNSNLNKSDNMAGFSRKRASRDQYKKLNSSQDQVAPENNDDGDLVEQAEMPNEQASKKNKLHLPLNKVNRSYATHISTQNTNEDGFNLH